MLSRLTEKQRQWALIIFFSVVTLAVLGYRLYHSFLPTASTYIADKIPKEIYQSIGQSALEQLDETEFSDSELDVTTQDAIRTDFNQLINELNLDPDRFTLHMRHWKGQMNAFALMDGSIVITDALVNNLNAVLDSNAPHDSEQALNTQAIRAVLLHEIGHIEHNHLMEHTIRVSLFYISASLIFGDISVVSQILLEGSTMGLNIAYSRDLEVEADQYAADQLTKLYGNPAALVQALTVLYQESEQESKSEPDLHWLSTHPNLEARLEGIK